MGFLLYSSELQKIILANIRKKNEEEYFHKVISLFNEKGFTIKVKHMLPNKPLRSFYRIFFFIKKSDATVVIDAKKDCDLTIYIRLLNHKILNKLSDFTDNIRNQILIAKDCSAPDSIDCKDKMYRFTFNNKYYIKCMSISCNFEFTNINKNDFENIIDIINEEIEYNLKNK